ncbi:hypothetical protein [Pararobbsia alpina]|nr:hypothetical protein [Pararobbsia alpina]
MQADNRLWLSHSVSQHMPLRDSKFGKVNLFNLGTHTPSGRR